MAGKSGPLPIEEARRLCPLKYEYADAEESYEYTVSVDCNAMKFTDDSGTEYDIYLPTGRAREAADHFVHKRWEELRKFPKLGEMLPCPLPKCHCFGVLTVCCEHQKGRSTPMMMT
jgi:hypothetical protein